MLPTQEQFHTVNHDVRDTEGDQMAFISLARHSSKQEEFWY